MMKIRKGPTRWKRWRLEFGPTWDGASGARPALSYDYRIVAVKWFHFALGFPWARSTHRYNLGARQLTPGVYTMCSLYPQHGVMPGVYTMCSLYPQHGVMAGVYSVCSLYPQDRMMAGFNSMCSLYPHDRVMAGDYSMCSLYPQDGVLAAFYYMYSLLSPSWSDGCFLLHV